MTKSERKLMAQALEYVHGYIYDMDNGHNAWYGDPKGKKWARRKAVALVNKIREII